MKPPPLGCRPRFIVAEQRLTELDEALERYIAAGLDLPEEWLEERTELLEWLRGREPKRPLERAVRDSPGL